MKKIEAIVRPSKLEPIKEVLFGADVKGMSISEVHGCGNQHGWKEFYRGSEVIVNTLPKVKFEIITTDDRVDELVKLIVETAQTGEVGDGKIFVLPVEEVVRIRTRESGEVAI
ncbi:MAG: P-II family nitrogen regulator [Coriobacteriales bacterium]|jgi:nitrogen regulatory protein P-II 1|nr:P-II family nitrogen regulator [Coriobacteriales bacterium]